MNTSDADHREGESDDHETGPPIVQLLGLEDDPQPQFFQQIQRMIDRRLFAGDVLQLFGANLFSVVLEWVAGFFEVFGQGASARTRDKE